MPLAPGGRESRRASVMSSATAGEFKSPLGHLHT
jgi:hypothetical protein